MGQNGHISFILGNSTVYHLRCIIHPALAFINKHYRGICHKIINRVGHKFHRTIHSALHTWLWLIQRDPEAQSVPLAANQFCNLSSPKGAESQRTNSP